MADTPKVYVICDQNCKFESLTKEQIFTAIIQAVNEGAIYDVDTGFIQTIKTINNVPLKFFVGEQAAYDALTEEQKENLFAIITNDTSKADLLAYLEEQQSEIKNRYTKAETVTDETKARFGLPAEALPNDVFNAIANKIEVVSYVGTGTYGVGNPNSITFSFAPKIIISAFEATILQTECFTTEFAAGAANQNKLVNSGYQRYTPFFKYSNSDVYNMGKKSEDGKTFTWYSHYSSNDTRYGIEAQNNVAGKVYTFIGIA